MNSELFIKVNLCHDWNVPALFWIVVNFLRVTHVNLVLVVDEDLCFDVLHLVVVEAASRPVVALRVRLHDLGCPVQVVFLGEAEREAVEALLQHVGSAEDLKVLKPFFDELRSARKV